ncbi:MAG TPA: Clp protease N-terminal domain-containing protein [Solirubrobacter sp.]
MFNKFTAEARTVVTDAVDIARDLGASSVEAEHLLLAITRGNGPVAHELERVGLDFDGLCAALVAETTRSLAAVGVSADAVAFTPYVERPKLATSAKLVLERSLRAAIAEGDKRISSKHLALGALRAPTGTVPRALQCADVDKVELTARISALNA